RLIMCESIEDKIVNHFIATNYLLKYLEKSFVYSNVATRKGKGSSLAINLFENYINKDCYILKMDITKYFYNIDHNIAINLLSKKIKDKNVLNIVKDIIDNTNQDYINENIIIIKGKEIRKINNLNISDKEKDKKILEINKIPLYTNGCGVPIGNMTSQILAVLYLNEVDHYIKEELKIKKYIRYMDDLVIIDDDYNNLLDYKKLIEKKINQYKLIVNDKCKIYSIKLGVEFLGYRYKYTNDNLVIKYNKQTITRINKKLKYLKKKDINKYLKSIASYKGFFDKSNTKLKEKYEVSILLEKYNFYKKEYPKHVILIKQGKFYKSKDYEIIWNKFNYKIINETVGFSDIDKVRNIFDYENISYVIDDGETNVISYDDNKYDEYYKLSVKNLDLEQKYNDLNKKVKRIITKDINIYYDLAKMLDSM
ncbi:MAG: RNA-directed DNA polymerase, partial [Bacilli bacterium]|nr:RNA-directed DNA polymerase [Bacilli bacterium]